MQKILTNKHYFKREILNELKGWVPTKLLSENNEHLCQWQYFQQERPLLPFFDDDTRQIITYPENRNQKVISTLSFLTELTNIPDKEDQSLVIIFHTSRCGSTLLTQLLNVDENNLCLSEVPFFD